MAGWPGGWAARAPPPPPLPPTHPLPPTDRNTPIGNLLCENPVVPDDLWLPIPLQAHKGRRLQFCVPRPQVADRRREEVFLALAFSTTVKRVFASSKWHKSCSSTNSARMVRCFSIILILALRYAMSSSYSSPCAVEFRLRLLLLYLCLFAFPLPTIGVFGAADTIWASCTCNCDEQKYPHSGTSFQLLIRSRCNLANVSLSCSSESVAQTGLRWAMEISGLPLNGHRNRVSKNEHHAILLPTW